MIGGHSKPKGVVKLFSKLGFKNRRASDLNVSALMGRFYKQGLEKTECKWIPTGSFFDRFVLFHLSHYSVAFDLIILLFE